VDVDVESGSGEWRGSGSHTYILIQNPVLTFRPSVSINKNSQIPSIPPGM